MESNLSIWITHVRNELGYSVTSHMVKTKAKDLLEEEAKEKGVPATKLNASKTWFSAFLCRTGRSLHGKLLVEIVKVQHLDGKRVRQLSLIGTNRPVSFNCRK
jgi:hypothetical protein